jgi:hypothetical protein
VTAIGKAPAKALRERWRTNVRRYICLGRRKPRLDRSRMGFGVKSGGKLPHSTMIVPVIEM